MNFTAREDYGLRAVLDLALHTDQGPVQSREIAARQGIPEQFLEQLLGALRRGGLIRSVRGAAGGYLLARPASQMTPGDVLRTLSGALVPIECLGKAGSKACEHASSSSVHQFWESLAAAIGESVDSTTVQEMADAQLASETDAGFMMNI